VVDFGSYLLKAHRKNFRKMKGNKKKRVHRGKGEWAKLRKKKRNRERGRRTKAGFGGKPSSDNQGRKH